MNKKITARSIRFNHRGKFDPSLSRSSNSKIYQKIALVFGLMCLVSCFISVKVLEGGRQLDKVLNAHDIHAMIKRHKLKVFEHINRKEDTTSEKENRKKSGNIIQEAKRSMEKNTTMELTNLDLLNNVNHKKNIVPKKRNIKKSDIILQEAKKNVGEVSDTNVETNISFVERLPMYQTPALIGASKGKIKCDAEVDSLVYWNDPQGTQDINFESPFIGDNPSGKTKYLSFQKDLGGWNNIRMSLETVIILAAVTQRTLVLPPNSPLYLLDADKQKKERTFADFFPLQSASFLKKVSIISTEEFIEREGKENGRFPIPSELQFKVNNAKKECFPMKKADNSCFAVYEYLESVGNIANFTDKRCLIIDLDKFHGSIPSDENQKKIEKFCGNQLPFYLSQELQQEPLIHFRNTVDNRMLGHFYGLMLFTDPVIDNHYKRFVRDFLHYHDAIFCAAGKIVNALQDMAKERGFSIDPSGSGGFSTMHVRRGDFQFKTVKISAEEWNDNLQDIWLDDEIIYIATDEKNKTFFDPIAKHHTLKFLDDFWNSTGLGDLDPNYMGMIETIVASRGRTFSGTWFSTFTGYINRIRGYHGMSMKSSYYGFLKRKFALHTWKESIPGNTYQYEWPSGWIGIDGDVIPNRESF